MISVKTIQKTTEAAIILKAVSRIFHYNDMEIEALKEVSLVCRMGDFLAITGVSGSGKTTLLNLLSGIDRPTDGVVMVLGETINEKDEDFLASWRSKNIGYVFQAYNLISTLTARENIEFPMELINSDPELISERVQFLLKTVGLTNRENHFPQRLSGGEQQRLALARALANDPPIILADEPTGNLDHKTREKIIEIFKAENMKGKTLVIATHDPGILKIASRVLLLKEGVISSNGYNKTSC